MSIILIAHNLRSSHNVGSLLRTADGLGVREVILSGYTPYPPVPPDSQNGGWQDGRLPHIAQKVGRQIDKTALGAAESQKWQYAPDIMVAIHALKKAGYTVAALEQAKGAKMLPEYRPPAKLALIVGREVEGLEPAVLAACDLVLEIPMRGRKESFNVAVAAAMALYHLIFAAD